MYDAIIIGGGPTGSYTAYRLAENGRRVLVLEKNGEAGHKLCCTGIVGMECVNTFKIDDKVILKKLNSATLFAPSGNSLRLYRKEPQAVILDRQAFDKYMVDKAQRAGAEYRFNCRAISIVIQSDGVEVTADTGGKQERITAKAAVIASGFNPGLNEGWGLGGCKDFTTGVQAEVEINELEEAEVYFGEIAPGFFGWLAPTAEGRAKAGLLSRKEAGPRLKRWLKQLEQQGRIRSAEARVHYGGIPLKPPARTYGDRLIAVGDAAGQVKPTTGGGIFYGLIGAETAADILHEALEDDDLKAKRLSGYEKAWQKKLGGELKTGYMARRLFERLNEEQIDRLFKAIRSSGIDEALLNTPDLSFDWHSRTIKKLLKYQIIVKPLKLFKLPFTSGRIDHKRK